MDRHVSALHRARQRGELRRFRILGRWYTDVQSIRDMIATSTTKPASAQPIGPELKLSDELRQTKLSARSPN